MICQTGCLIYATEGRHANKTLFNKAAARQHEPPPSSIQCKEYRASDVAIDHILQIFLPSGFRLRIDVGLAHPLFDLRKREPAVEHLLGFGTVPAGSVPRASSNRAQATARAAASSVLPVEK
jgi:hypothetical protein